jgi:PadR family transcriptional regulator, regulatory protein PadR
MPTEDLVTSIENISQLEEEILTVLLGRELYGMQIIQAFKEASSGAKTIGPGSLYPTLSKLEDKELITSREAERPLDEKGGARRKYFRITEKGAHVLTNKQRFRSSLYSWQAT